MTFSGSSLGTLELQLTANQAALQAQLNQTRAYATQVARDIEQQINRAFGGTRRGNTQLPGLQNAASQGAAAGASAGKSFADKFKDVIAPMKGAIDSIFNGALEKAGASAFSSVTDVIGSAVDAVKGFAGQIFNVTKDFQGFESSLKTFLKGNQQEIDKFVAGLEKFAATTPYELKDLQQAAIQNLATGAKPDQILKDLKSIGDVASGANASIKDLMEVYAKSRTEGRLQNDDIDQFTGRGVQLRAQLAKQLGASEQEVRQLASDGKLEFRHLEEAIRAMSGQGGAYFDAMKNKATTLEGKLSNVSDTFYQFQKQLGQAFEPLFSVVTDFLGQLVSGLTNNKDLMAELKAQTQELANYFKQNPEIAENLSKALNELVRGAMSALVAGAKQLGEYLKENPRAIQDAVSGGIALGREIAGVVNNAASLVGYIVEFTKGVKDAAIAVRDVLGGAMKSLGIGEKKDDPVSNFLFGDVSQQQADLKNKLYPKNALSSSTSDTNSSSGNSVVGAILATTKIVSDSLAGLNSNQSIKSSPYKIVESVGEHTEDVHGYRELEKHHPSRGRESGRDYETIDGKLEEVRRTGGRTLIKKDFVLSQNGSQNVPTPSPAAGRARVSSAYGTVAILDDNGNVIGQALHMKDIKVKTGDIVQYGQTIGTQSGVGSSGNPGEYPVHSHIELPKEKWQKYIQDLLDGVFDDGKKAVSGNKNPVLNAINQVVAPVQQALATALSGGKTTTSSGDVLWGKAANYAPSDLSKLTPAGKEALEALKNPNVRAWLDSVAVAENGAIANTTGGYGVLVGSENKETFDPNTLKTHPRRVVGKGKNASTATGRYQTMDFVWDDDTEYGAKGLGLVDFKPQSQEILAVGRMKYRKILDKVMAGDIEGALQRRSSNYDAPSEWASLEGNPYNQGTDGGKRSTFLANFRRFRNDLQSATSNQPSQAQQSALPYGPPLPTSSQLATTASPTSPASATGGNVEDDRNLVTSRRKLAESKGDEIKAEIAAANRAQDASVKQQRELDAERRASDGEARKSQLQLQIANAPDSEAKKIVERNLSLLEIQNKQQEQAIKDQQELEDLMKARNRKQQAIAESEKRKQQIAATEQDPQKREEKIRAESINLKEEEGIDYTKAINQKLQIIELNKQNNKQELDTFKINDSNALQQEQKVEVEKRNLGELTRAHDELINKLKAEQEAAKTQEVKQIIQLDIDTSENKYQLQQALIPLENQLDDLKKRKVYFLGEGGLKEDSEQVKELQAQIVELEKNIAATTANSKASLTSLQNEGYKTIESGRFTDLTAQLNKEQGLVSSRTSVLQGQATLIRNRGGNEYQASALEAEASQMQEQIRYKQELLQIEQQIAAVKGKAGEYTDTEIATMKANAEALNKINLESISGQVKTLGKDLMDVSKNALGGFFTDIISGSKSAGDAFKDLIGNIANQLTQLAVNQLISGIFGGGGLPGGKGGGGFLGGLLGFYQGGIVPNYAVGGSVGAIADALQRERSASGRNPVLAALTPGEMVLTVEQTKRFQELRLDKVLNFANGGMVSEKALINSNDGNGGMTINIPVTVQNSPTSVDVPRLQSSVRAVVVEELLKQQRPGGALNR